MYCYHLENDSFVLDVVLLERNERCFENKERSLEEIREFFFKTLCLWAKAIVMNGEEFLDLL